jgi:TatD DNase family protein
MLVDVHTHVTDKAFIEDLDQVIKESGCSVIINNGYTPEGNRKTLELAKKYTQIKVALGLHPSETAVMEPKDIEKEILFISKQEGIIAIGEIGLDFTYENHDQQIKYFKQLVQVALDRDLPVICHSRKAEKKVIEILEEMKVKKALLHCYTGKIKLAEKAEKLGYYFSIPPIIAHSTHFQEMVKRISMGKILTETDAPFLSHEKGERNEPKNVKFTVGKIAEIKELDKKEVENLIYMNYQNLFS